MSHCIFSWSSQRSGVSKTTSSLSEQQSHAHNSHPLITPPIHSIYVLTTNNTSSSTPPVTTIGMSRHSLVSVNLCHTGKPQIMSYVVSTANSTLQVQSTGGVPSQSPGSNDLVTSSPAHSVNPEGEGVDPTVLAHISRLMRLLSSDYYYTSGTVPTIEVRLHGPMTICV